MPETLFSIASAAVVPGWLLLLFAPRWRHGAALDAGAGSAPRGAPRPSSASRPGWLVLFGLALAQALRGHPLV